MIYSPRANSLLPMCPTVSTYSSSPYAGSSMLGEGSTVPPYRVQR
uniref:Uncharacterized protein n=1 Tax=Arundo donax TaxID=35708 RepID=A0A0A9FSN9_ARUDO